MKLIAAICGVIAVILITSSGIFNIFDFSAYKTENYIKKFKIYKDDFKGMVEYIAELSLTNIQEEQNILWLDNPQFLLTDSSGTKINIELPPQVLTHLKGIEKTFETGENFNRIIIEKERIAFCVEGNLCAIIYTTKDKVPGYMLKENELRKIKVKKIIPKWYILTLY